MQNIIVKHNTNVDDYQTSPNTVDYTYKCNSMIHLTFLSIPFQNINKKALTKCEVKDKLLEIKCQFLFVIMNKKIELILNWYYLGICI